MNNVSVLSVEVLPGYRLSLAFSDGTTGVVDLANELWGSDLEALRKPERFAQARVARGTIAWPNGATFGADWLYESALSLNV